MRYLSFRHRDRIAAGLWLPSGVLHLQQAAQIAGESTDLSSVLAIVRGGDGARGAVSRLLAGVVELQQALIPHEDLRLLAPIPQPLRNPFCVGRNYLDHAKEGFVARGMEVRLPEAPQFFTKATHTVCGPNDEVRLDSRVTRRFDYEVELAVVLGRGGRDIPADRAADYIFGYMVANDFTARDLQRRHDQWFKGKSLDTTLPLGPWLITADEIGDPNSLELTLSVNGEERQRAKVSQMIFDLPGLIASLSAGLTLEAGDIIATGTPAGVGFAMQPPRYLRGGDVVISHIDRIGSLHNRIVEVSA
jgi:2-keto-4-pentenoate hydratase/2-oxohepta-3-ene-1,7-dioic acid hydratase in catechol pathway